METTVVEPATFDLKKQPRSIAAPSRRERLGGSIVTHRGEPAASP